VPTYQYACLNADCGNQFELVQSFTDAAVTACPVCGQPVRKVFGSVGVVFKGSGFYRTDSRTADKIGAKSDSSKSSAATTASSSDSSSSSTPAAASTSAGSSSGGSTSAA
jgi:putative FmdB family regulatory protein